MEFNIMSPDFYSRVRLPYSQIIQSLNFLFHNDNDDETTARINCQFVTPDHLARSNNIVFGPHTSLIEKKKLNYLMEKQSHSRLATSHLNNQILSDQLLSNYYAMSVATVTNNSNNKLALHGQMSGVGPQKPQPRKKFTNDYSISLSREENEYLFSLLGDRCITLATAVIELFLSEAPNHTRWRKKLTGVACFVKDNNRRNYFIRVYDLDHAQTCVWQQELYFTFQYLCPRTYFHTFEADKSMAALNFATEKEAEQFRRVVLEKVNTMNQKQQEKKKAQQQRLNALNQQQGNFSVPTLGNLSLGNSSYQSSNNVSTKEQKKKDKKEKKDKKKYCKEDIGAPTNFQHLHHVGWNSAGQSIDSQLKKVLEEAGVSTHQYTNPETRQFIHQFVEDYKARQDPSLSNQDNSIGYPSSNYNGYAQQPPQPPQLPQQQQQQRYNQNKSNGPPPLPQTQPSYTYNNPTTYSNSTPHHQQLNGRNIDNHNLSNNVNNQQQQQYVSKPAPPIPSGGPQSISSYKSTAPKPPPLPASLMNNSTNNNNKTTSPTVSKDIPPPPPLPTLNQLQSTTTTNTSTSSDIPKPPPLPKNISQAPETRNALLDQIRQGRNLKKVDKTAQPTTNPASSGPADTRDALLDQIRQGKRLKHVSASEEKPAPALNTSGLAGALAKALQERSRVLQQTDESSSDSSDIEDEEWSD